MISSSTEVLTPLWTMMNVVERDWESWSIFNHPERGISKKLKERYEDITLEEDEEEDPEPFPEYGSTAKFLEILGKHNIFFDTYTGEWKDLPSQRQEVL